MKTTLFITALLVACAAKAQDTQPPKPADTPPKTERPAPEPLAKEKKKDKKAQACSDVPPGQQVRYKMPAEWQKAIDKQRAEIERKTGIVFPPPPPPKVVPPCPPVVSKPPEDGKK